jgi:hypothetical protein
MLVFLQNRRRVSCHNDTRTIEKAGKKFSSGLALCFDNIVSFEVVRLSYLLKDPLLQKNLICLS